eukprot:scaffold454560_cov55-Prasinocladus_malaysianus.AAC.1
MRAAILAITTHILIVQNNNELHNAWELLTKCLRISDKLSGSSGRNRQIQQEVTAAAIGVAESLMKLPHCPPDVFP